MAGHLTAPEFRQRPNPSAPLGQANGIWRGGSDCQASQGTMRAVRVPRRASSIDVLRNIPHLQENGNAAARGTCPMWWGAHMARSWARESGHVNLSAAAVPAHPAIEPLRKSAPCRKCHSIRKGRSRHSNGPGCRPGSVREFSSRPRASLQWWCFGFSKP
jgi:hypothetical protein